MGLPDGDSWQGLRMWDVRCGIAEFGLWIAEFGLRIGDDGCRIYKVLVRGATKKKEPFGSTV